MKQEVSIVVPNHRFPSCQSVILSILILLVLYVGLSAARNTRKLQERVLCCEKLKAIGTAWKIYAGDIPDATPPLNWLVQQGRLDQADTVCPSATDEKSSYVVVSQSQRSVNLKGGVLMHEPPGNHEDGVNVLFADGLCKFVPLELLPTLNIPENQGKATDANP